MGHFIFRITFINNIFWDQSWLLAKMKIQAHQWLHELSCFKLVLFIWFWTFLWFFFRIKHIYIFVSATRSRKDTKIPFCLSAPVRKSLIWCVTTMNTRKSAIFMFSTGNNFLSKFRPKIQNCLFKVKFGTKTNSNIQNSMVMFIFFCFWLEIPFLSKCGSKKSKVPF